MKKQLLINNEWRDASGGKTMEVINPATEAELAPVAEGDAADIAYSLLTTRPTMSVALPAVKEMITCTGLLGYPCAAAWAATSASAANTTMMPTVDPFESLNVAGGGKLHVPQRQVTLLERQSARPSDRGSLVLRRLTPRIQFEQAERGMDVEPP